jgi:cytochrome b6-f complex iron-sulfur subunit
MDRRDFLQKSLYLTVGMAGIASLVESCSKSNTQPSNSAPTVDFTIDISTSQYSALKTNGNYVYYSADNIIIARDVAGNFIALYDVCPHASCTIQFDGKNTFPCPCHGSVFNESGNVTTGPATSGVKKYNTSLNGTQLRIYG